MKPTTKTTIEIRKGDFAALLRLAGYDIPEKAVVSVVHHGPREDMRGEPMGYSDGDVMVSVSWTVPHG
jgi:hypothetical protein